ncbi:MAG: prolyl oligopeptidase family serine peptidase [Wenzhouxiangella sp.]
MSRVFVALLPFSAALLVTLLLARPSAAELPAALPALDYDDVFLLEAVSDPQPSPSGERIVFVRNWMDRQTDRARSSLWIVAADGRGLEPLTDRDSNASSPRWSPDGERLAYLAGGELRMHWLASGRDSRIAELGEAPGHLSWSPDGRWLAFTLFTPDAARSPVTLPGRPEGASWAPAPIWIDQPRYRSDGQGFLRQGHRHVYLLPAEGGSPIQISDGPYDHGHLAWHPDGQSLFVEANRRDEAHRFPLKSSIYRIDIDSREISPVTEGNDPQRQPRVSPDGRRLAWLGFEDRKLSHQANRLFVADLDGSNVRELTDDLDRHINQFAWADNNSLLIQYDHHGKTLLARQRLNGRRDVLTESLGGEYFSRPYSSGQFAIGGGLIAHTHASTQRPSELAVIGRNGSRVLTDLNRDFLAQRTVGQVESFWYTSSVDGLDLQGWVMYPPGFDPDAQWPMILEIHGGPFATYGDYFAMELQLMAAQGYVVVYLNPRGSTSYGEDFANLIHHNYPSHDHDDLMDGVNAVIARGYIDEDALFITGGSGGGVLTTWAISKTDRFAAAAAVNPVINWYSFVLSADLYFLFSQYWFPGPPWEHAEHYLAHSPIHRVGYVNTPTLLLTGEEDWRTPMSETEQYYQALQLRGVDTAMVRVPEASHALHRRPSQLMAKPAFVIEWFERYRHAD